MCCCGKPVINGEMGYRWQPNDPPTVREVNPPDIGEAELLYDEPGRCGGIDSHCHHYRLVHKYGSVFLHVRHGGGDEHFRLSVTPALMVTLEAFDSTARYWLFNAIYHAQADAKRAARDSEAHKWTQAIVEKRVKISKRNGNRYVQIISPFLTDNI